MAALTIDAPLLEYMVAWSQPNCFGIKMDHVYVQRNELISFIGFMIKTLTRVPLFVANAFHSGCICNHFDKIRIAFKARHENSIC